MHVLDFIIIVLLFTIGYCYVLYPMIVRLLGKSFPKPTEKDETYSPKISIILAVYNEEIVLESCLDSLLALDYPKELLEIIVGSDGSTDKTNEILSSYNAQYPFIKTMTFSSRRGKMPVLNDLVLSATGDILFFADADISLSPNTLKVQLRHFVDPSVGAIGGGYHIHTETEKGLSTSEKEYASKEQKIRVNEGIFSSSIGVFGGNYTIRRELWRPLPDALVHDDLFVALNVIDKKKRVVYEPESTSVDIYERSLKDEFRRKSRSASRGYHTLSFFQNLVGFSGGTIAFQIWSHKILRWLSPFILMAIVTLGILGFSLYQEIQYSILFFGFIAVMSLTFVGWLFEIKNIRIPILHQLTWLVIMNIAYIAGTIKFLLRSDEGMWTQATRQNISNTSYSVKEAADLK